MGGTSISINHMHSDNNKLRSFVALLFVAGDVRRWVSKAKNVASTVMHKFAYHIGDAGAFLARRITAGIPGVF